jgi:hypothetical protein
MSWRDSIRRIVFDRDELAINIAHWARTNDVTQDAIILCIAEHRTERDAIDVLKARPEAEDIGQ